MMSQEAKQFSLKTDFLEGFQARGIAGSPNPGYRQRQSEPLTPLTLRIRETIFFQNKIFIPGRQSWISAGVKGLNRWLNCRRSWKR
jgi:hypothetical protein